MLIGRDAIGAEIGRLLAEERLLTLVGTGGIGKTRLARDVARRTQGAVVADVAGGEGASAIADAVATAIGAVEPDEGEGEARLGRIGAALDARGETLLVLDEMDRAIASAGVIETWLGRAPRLRVLATSRERLGLAAERVLEVDPLSEAAAVEMLRALAKRAGVPIGEAEAPFLAGIARVLEGIPLALELAASRIGVMGPRGLLHRLEERFDVLRKARGAATPERHAAMDDAIAWSWALLRPWERDALAQCTVFRGGLTVGSAEAVVDLGGQDGAPAVIDVVQALREKSLLRTLPEVGIAGEVRLAPFEVVRSFAAVRCEAGAARAAEGRHTAWFVGAGERWARELDGPGGVEARQRLLAERENLLAVVQRVLGGGPITAAAAEPALRALLALAPVLIARGPLGAYAETIDRAVDAMRGSGADPRLLAGALAMRGRVSRHLGRIPEGVRDLREALDLARKMGDAALEAEIAVRLARVLADGGEVAEARALADRAAEGGAASVGPLAERLGVLGDLAAQEGDVAQALERHREAVKLLDLAQSLAGQVAARRRLATALIDAGEHEAAREEIGKALETAAAIDDRAGAALAELALSALEEATGETDLARARSERATQALHALGHRVPGERAPQRAASIAPPTAAPADALVVGPNGEWFRAPHGEAVSLRRRPPLARILAALAERRTASPGKSASSGTLVAAGWPGEKMIADAGTHRVRVAIATLRKMGLREVIETAEDGGYRLAAGVAVHRG